VKPDEKDTIKHDVVNTFQALHYAYFNKPIAYNIAKLELQELTDLIRLTLSKDGVTNG